MVEIEIVSESLSSLSEKELKELFRIGKRDITKRLLGLLFRVDILKRRFTVVLHYCFMWFTTGFWSDGTYKVRPAVDLPKMHGSSLEDAINEHRKT